MNLEDAARAAGMMLSHEDWAKLVMKLLREGGLPMAVQLIRLAPAHIQPELSRNFTRICPDLLGVANDM